MRVLLISHTCQSRTEGQPKAVELAKFHDVELRVLVPDRWMHYGVPRAAEPPLPGTFDCQVGKVRWPWLPGAQFYLHYYQDLRAILKNFQPDVIDLWEEPWALVSAHAVWLRNRFLPKARIISETEQNILKNLPPPFEQIRSYVLRNADFVVGRNEESLDVVRRKGYRGAAATVPNGVDADLFRPLNRAQARAEILPATVPPGAFVAGYVGRLVPEKGVIDLVDALVHCPSNVHLLFVGSGPCRDEIAQRAAGIGKAAHVHFLGARPLEALPVVMNALDVLVLPSRTTPRWKEQYGRVIIEAQACGRPVIGSNSGAIPDVVGQGGLVFRETQIQDLTAALVRMESNRIEAEAMGELGRRRVLAECTWERVAEQMVAIYRRLAPPNSTRSVGAQCG